MGVKGIHKHNFSRSLFLRPFGHKLDYFLTAEYDAKIVETVL
jgi:hypothetical protein